MSYKSQKGPRPKASAAALISTVFHASLILLLVAPYRSYRSARLSTPAVAAVERVEYASLLPFRRHGARAVAKAAPVREAARRPKPEPELPQLAINVAIELPTPEPLVEMQSPALVDTLWRDGLDRSISANVYGVVNDREWADAERNASPSTLSDRGALPRPENPKPEYPAEMARRFVGAEFTVSFIVDTTGTVDLATVDIPSDVHTLFAHAVRQALKRWRFYPAERMGHHSRQLFQQPFIFRMVSTNSSARSEQ
jgi:TonB family protein